MGWSLKNLIKRHSNDPLVRRRAWNKFYERKLHRRGLHLYKAHLNWTQSTELAHLHQQWGATPGIPADRCAFLHALAKLVAQRAVPGDTAECGVRYGKSSFFLLSGLADPGRCHHIFDSFAGLSAVAERDRAPAGIKSWQQGDISVAEEAARQNLADFPQCRFYRGWIPDKFQEVEDITFSFVHIDVDLFQPTWDAFEFFYPRMAPGGMMLCDDYGFASCPGATEAVDQFFASRPEFVLPVPTGQCLITRA